MKSSLAVVILNYKVAPLVKEAIQTIRGDKKLLTYIIVVDNNSEDGIEEVVSGFSNIKFIQTGDNLGYTGGNNVGIKEALKTEAEYILILNPDALIQKGALEKLLNFAQNNHSDITGPKIYFNDSKRIWFAGGVFDEDNVLGSHRGVNSEDEGQFEKAYECDYVTGAAMLVHRDVFNKIGLLDDRYFLYYEDSDFCFRARRAGFKIMYYPKAVFFHHNAQSTGLGSPLQDYFITRNRLLFAFKFLSWRTRFALLREALKNINNPIRRLSLADFLLGKFGKGSFLK